MQELMLIVITMFAAVGAYYLSELFVQTIFKDKRMPHSVVVMAQESPEQAWADVLKIRSCIQGQQVLVVCPRAKQVTKMQAALHDVTVIQANCLPRHLCQMLKLNQEETKSDE